MRAKLNLSASPPDPTTIQPDILALHNTIAARYVGAASLISLKTPEEGLRKQRSLMRRVKEGHKGELEKIYRMSSDQQSVYHAGLTSYITFGGHGSGQTKYYVFCTIIDYKCFRKDAPHGSFNSSGCTQICCRH